MVADERRLCAFWLQQRTNHGVIQAGGRVRQWRQRNGCLCHQCQQRLCTITGTKQAQLVGAALKSPTHTTTPTAHTPFDQAQRFILATTPNTSSAHLQSRCWGCQALFAPSNQPGRQCVGMASKNLTVRTHKRRKIWRTRGTEILRHKRHSIRDDARSPTHLLQCRHQPVSPLLVGHRALLYTTLSVMQQLTSILQRQGTNT